MFELLLALHHNIYIDLSKNFTWLNDRDLSAAFQLLQYPDAVKYMERVIKHPILDKLLYKLSEVLQDLSDEQVVRSLYSLRCILLTWDHSVMTDFYLAMTKRSDGFRLVTHANAVVIARVLRDHSLVKSVLDYQEVFLQKLYGTIMNDIISTSSKI